MKRIGIVDDNVSIVSGVRSMLAGSPNLLVAASAGTVAGLVQQKLDLDVVLLDLRLDDGSSPRTNVEDLRSAGLAALVYTGADSSSLVRQAVKANVLGVLRKSAPEPVAVHVITAAADGHHVMTPEWAAAIDADPALTDLGFTASQQDVLSLLASGETTDRVAQLTGSTIDTVNNHIARIRAMYTGTASVYTSA